MRQGGLACGKGGYRKPAGARRFLIRPSFAVADAGPSWPGFQPAPARLGSRPWHRLRRRRMAGEAVGRLLAEGNVA